MITKIFTAFTLLFFSAKGYCQYDFIIDSLSLQKGKAKMTEQGGAFELISHSNVNNNRMYKFNNSKINLTYIENNSANMCDSLILFGKRVGIKGKFEDDRLACHLDVTSLQVFTFSFRNKKYVLVESIKNASGIAASYIIFHLFDITDKWKILYFPAWSAYGSKSCFGDFNNDGRLDFLFIRPISTTVDVGTYRVTLSSIDYSSRTFKSSDNYRYITFRRAYNKKNDMVITVLKKKW